MENAIEEGSMIIINDHSFQSEMLEDFNREIGELKILSNSLSKIHQERARDRLEVVEESVKQLKKEMSGEKKKEEERIEGGYGKEEMERFYTNLGGS